MDFARSACSWTNCLRQTVTSPPSGRRPVRPSPGEEFVQRAVLALLVLEREPRGLLADLDAGLCSGAGFPWPRPGLRREGRRDRQHGPRHETIVYHHSGLLVVSRNRGLSARRTGPEADVAGARRSRTIARGGRSPGAPRRCACPGRTPPAGDDDDSMSARREGQPWRRGRLAVELDELEFVCRAGKRDQRLAGVLARRDVGGDAVLAEHSEDVEWRLLGPGRPARHLEWPFPRVRRVLRSRSASIATAGFLARA